jgi:hypothetical protein
MLVHVSIVNKETYTQSRKKRNLKNHIYYKKSMKSKPKKQKYTSCLNRGKKLYVQIAQQQKIKKHY